MMDKPEEFIPGRVPVDENANKKLSFTSDVHGNTRMLRDFFSYSLNELNCDYVILGGDLGPRGVEEKVLGIKRRWSIIMER